MTKHNKISDHHQHHHLFEELTTLNDLLNEDESNLKEFVFNMDQVRGTTTPESPLGSNRLKSMRLSDSSTDSGVNSTLESDLRPSISYEEYFEVETCIDSSHKKLEAFGSKNSLFLAVARSILYKIYTIDRKYRHLLKIAYSDCLGTAENVKFNSDLRLQEALRRSLCSYWLSFVYNGEFIADCKYSSHFENACDFIYQAYQLSVNNFCTNRLFEQFALEDLAELMRIRIVAFDVKTGDESEPPSVKVYEPSIVKNKTSSPSSMPMLNDSIYLKVVQAGDMNTSLYKWLMPKRLRAYIDDNVLLKHDDESSTSASSFLRLKPAYVRYKILLPHDVLRERFDTEFINKSVNHAVFLRFLSECSVHTLVSLDEIKFDPLIRSSDSTLIIDYLNGLWGKNHFNIKEIFNQIQLNNELERIQTENKNFIQEVFKYSSIKSRELTSDGDKEEEHSGEVPCETKNGSGEQLPIDYSLKSKSNCFVKCLETNFLGVGLASKRKSVSECSSSDNTSSGRLSTNLYQMSSCFRDDNDDRLRRLDGACCGKLSKSCQEIGGTESGVGESISVSPNSVLESWKNLTLPLMNSLMVHRLLNTNPATTTQTTMTMDHESTTTKGNSKSNSKLNGGTHPKRSLTWCLDSLINQSSLTTGLKGVSGDLLKKRDAISSHDLSK